MRRAARRSSHRTWRDPTDCDLALAGVTFAYSPHADPVVRDLTLDIPHGLHLAVVGPSGAGKSTLANLLARLATPQRGGLRLGGPPMEQIDESHLRHTVALNPQEAYVFAGTVRENLTYLRPWASESDLDTAVAAIGLGQAISRLGGYDGEIEPGGGSLSPGERQLIALARAYLQSSSAIGAGWPRRRMSLVVGTGSGGAPRSRSPVSRSCILPHPASLTQRETR